MKINIYSPVFNKLAAVCAAAVILLLCAVLAGSGGDGWGAEVSGCAEGTGAVNSGTVTFRFETEDGEVLQEITKENVRLFGNNATVSVPEGVIKDVRKADDCLAAAMEGDAGQSVSVTFTGKAGGMNTVVIVVELRGETPEPE